MYTRNQLIGTVILGAGLGLVLSVCIGGWFLRLILGIGLAAIGFLLGRCRFC